jgi:hypothetical protein
MSISATWQDILPDIRLFSVSGIQLDIGQGKSGIRPDITKQNYLVIRISGASL